MLSFFRRKKPAASSPAPVAPHADPTFHERVIAFWRWFESVAPRFYQTIEAGQCASLADETSAAVDALGKFAWVYGPGENLEGHSLTISGEGNIHRQLLLLHWLACAPKIPGWSFYAARQPGPIAGHAIEMGGERFEPEKIWVTPVPNAEGECIDLTIWHPAWDKIDERQRTTVTFLFLDESLGEYGTDWWVGKIEYGKNQLAGSFPLAELAEYVFQTAARQGWKKSAPGETISLFRLEEPAGDFPRGNIFSQATAVSRLFHDYMKAEGELPDPLQGTGADYVYVTIASEFFPKGAEVAKRGEVEDALDAALRVTRGGRCIGGAFAPGLGYVDLLLLDGARSVDTVRKTLKELNVPAGTIIEYFALEKRAQRIAL